MRFVAGGQDDCRGRLRSCSKSCRFACPAVKPFPTLLAILGAILGEDCVCGSRLLTWPLTDRSPLIWPENTMNLVIPDLTRNPAQASNGVP